MRLSNTKHHQRMEINMTPMIDVVFQLLIFFMTCSQVSEVNREPLELPKLAGSNDQSRGDFTVNINAEGEYRVAGMSSSVADIISLCGEEIARSHPDEPERLTVVVRTDRRSLCRPVNELLSALTRINVHKVRLAVQTE
jgi:biopolymer transport protein ExbD